MLRIVICEDNPIQQEKVYDFVEDTIIKEQYDFELGLCTSKPGEVLQYLDKEPFATGIYFLDVDLNSTMNGIELAENIRKKDPLGYIIFITTHSEMTYLTFKYKVEAMDFIIKDNYENIKNHIAQCMKYISQNYFSKVLQDEVISFQQENRVINISLKDILFIETSTNAHKLIIHEEKRQIEIYGSLKEIESKLNDNFYRCHRAYFVNKKKIKEIDKKERIIHMVNGETCFASFRAIGGLLK